MAIRLKIKGLRALNRNIIDNIWAAAAHIEGHVTTQMEKFMGTLSQSVTDLSTAIANEFDDIRAAAESTLTQLREQLEAVGSENVELKEALEAQVATSEDYLQQINDAQSRIDALVEELQSNDQTGNGDEHPDRDLPGNQPYPDQSLPGSQPLPDQSLPGDQPLPDQSLPGDQPEVDPGDVPYVDPRGGRRGGRK